MKIVSVAQPLGGRGGVQMVIQALDSALTQSGHQMITCLTGPSIDDRSWEHALERLYIGSAKRLTIRKAWTVCPLIEWLRRVILLEEPDIVVAHDVTLVPIIKVCMLLLPRCTPSRIIAYDHGDFAVLYKQSRVYQALYRSGLRMSDAVVCGGQDCADAINGQVSRVRAMSIGIPIKEPVEIIQRSTKAPRIVFVGRLFNEAKRVDRLLKACGGLPKNGNWVLQIVGDGEDRLALQNMARDLGIWSHCEWSGWHDDPWSVVADATILAFPSDHEGFSAVMVEAMVRGIPVLATDCDYGPRTVIQNGINGWLVPRDDEEFTRKLVEIASGSEVLPSPNQVQSTVQGFSPQEIAIRFLELCQQLIVGQPIADGECCELCTRKSPRNRG